MPGPGYAEGLLQGMQAQSHMASQASMMQQRNQQMQAFAQQMARQNQENAFLMQAFSGGADLRKGMQDSSLMEAQANKLMQVGSQLMKYNWKDGISMIEAADKLRSRKGLQDVRNIEVMQKKAERTNEIALTVTDQASLDAAIQEMTREGIAPPPGQYRTWGPQAQQWWDRLAAQSSKARQTLTTQAELEYVRAQEGAKAVAEKRDRASQQEKDAAQERLRNAAQSVSVLTGKSGATNFLGNEDVTRIAENVINGEELPRYLNKADAAAVQKKVTELVASGEAVQHYAKGVYAQTYAQRQTQAGQVLLSEMSNIGNMKLGQTAGLFADVAAGKGLTSSVKKAFGNKFTSVEEAEYNSSMTGLGVEIATLLSSGRQPQEHLINDFNQLLRANKGDAVETTLYKQAVAVNLARNALSVAPSANAEDRANKQRILKELSRFPSPQEVRKAAEDTGHSIRGLSDIHKQMQRVSAGWQESRGSMDESGRGQGETKPSGAGGLPAGWTVKEK